MRLGLNLRYLGALGAGCNPDVSSTLVREAEQLGFSVVWTAEVFSSDAVSLLSWLAAQTTRIELGTAVMQIPGRTPAMTAMTAATVDLLSHGRFLLGLGVSGPQVSEGWHGAPFDHPLARTREYIDIVRMALRRERLAYAGDHYTLGSPDGRALRLGLRPVRTDIPIYLAALGTRNVQLAGEIADGWLSVFFEPESSEVHLANLRAGRHRAGRDLVGFDVVAAVPVVVGEDAAVCRERVRMFTAHYLGGMGTLKQNFYNRLAARTGYADAVHTVQQSYLTGDMRAAAAAVPTVFLERTCLVGSVDRIADRLCAYADAGVGTLAAMVFPEDAADGLRTLRAIADAWDKSGVGR
jgi:F420-dependent oxidoreductase-like protein